MSNCKKIPYDADCSCHFDLDCLSNECVNNKCACEKNSDCYHGSISTSQYCYNNVCQKGTCQITEEKPNGGCKGDNFCGYGNEFLNLGRTSEIGMCVSKTNSGFLGLQCDTDKECQHMYQNDGFKCSTIPNSTITHKYCIPPTP